MYRWFRSTATILCLSAALASLVAQPPASASRRFFALGDFQLENGIVLPNTRIACATFGALNRERSNAILLPSWYGSDYHGYDFLIRSPMRGTRVSSSPA